MNEDILFFTVATQKHRIFVLPYILFALHHNHDARVEIWIDGYEDFVKLNESAFQILDEFYRRRYLIGSLPRRFDEWAEKREYAQLIRFLVEPETRLSYTYIGDVDILILEGDIKKFHESQIMQTNGYYSNIVRSRKKKKLTGLHCVDTERYYEATRRTREKYTSKENVERLSDEEVLFSIVKESIGDPAMISGRRRPVHGYHLSFNRNPLGDNWISQTISVVKGRYPRPGWGLTHKEKPYNDMLSLLLGGTLKKAGDSYKEYRRRCRISLRWLKSYESIKKTPQWERLLGTFDGEFRELIERLDRALQPF